MAKRQASEAPPAVDEGSGHRLQLLHSFGVRSAPPRDAVISLWDDSFLFLTGRHVAVCDHARHRFAVLRRDARGRAITAMAKSANCKLLALAERVGGEEGFARICVLVLPQVDRLMSVPLEKQEAPQVIKVLQPANRRLDVVSLAFAADSKFLVSLSVGAASTVTFWRWEIDKALASHDIEHPITRLQVNPRQANQFSVSGPKILRLWTFQAAESQLEESASMFKGNQERQIAIADHCWVLGSFLCAAAEAGMVYLFLEAELKQIVDVHAAISRDEADRRENISEKAKARRRVERALGMPKSDASLKFSTVAPWSQGFAVAGNRGCLVVFKVEQDSSVEPLGTFRMQDEDSCIWSMTAGSEDSQIMTILSYTEEEADNDMPMPSSILRAKSASKLKIGGPSPAALQPPGAHPVVRRWSLYTFPVGQSDMPASDQLEVFSPVQMLGVHGHHTGRVTAIGTSGVRNLLVTCGRDSNLKVWSYPSEEAQGTPSRFGSDLNLALGETAHAVAVHPLGFQVAVALEDMVRIYHLTTHEVYMRTLLDLPLKHPGPVAYSNSGGMLAVTADSEIILLDPLRAVIIHMINGRGGHLSPVSQVLFSVDDRKLFSCSAAPHGAIYGWDMESPGKERIFDHVCKGSSFSGLGYDFRQDLVVALVRPEGFLRIVGQLTTAYQVDVKPESSAGSYTCLCLAAPIGMLFAGTQAGSVAVFSWPPPEGDRNPRPLSEVALHADSITALAVSENCQLVFSACEEGTVIASEVFVANDLGGSLSSSQLDQRSVDYRYRVGEQRLLNRDDEKKKLELQRKLDERFNVSHCAAVSEMVMLPKSYLKELLVELNVLEERMGRLEHETEFVLEQKDIEMKEKLKAIEQEKQEEEKLTEFKHQSIATQLKDGLEKSRLDLQRSQEHFEKNVRDLQSEYESKLSKEYDKESLLLNDLEQHKLQKERDMKRLEIKYEKELQNLRAKMEKQQVGMRAEYNNVSSLLVSDSLRFEEVLRQQESEYQTRLEEMTEQHTAEIHTEAQRLDKVAKESVGMKQGLRLMQKQLRDVEEEKIQIARRKEELEKKLQERNDMLSQVREQLKERERGLKVKDEALAKLREQTKHLESFRFVLFHKVRVLEEERDPLEEQVNNLKSSVRDMYAEFVREFKNRQRLKAELEERDHLSGALQSEVAEQRASLVRLKKASLHLFQDLEVVLHPDTQAEFELMPKRLAAVLEKYQKVREWLPRDGELLQEEVVEALKVKDDTLRDLVMQRDLLFRKNQTAVAAAGKARTDCNQDFRRLVDQNTELIHECNTLRGENCIWKRSCGHLESKCMALNAKAKRLDSRLRTTESTPGRSPSRVESAPSIGFGEQEPARRRMLQHVRKSPTLTSQQGRRPRAAATGTDDRGAEGGTQSPGPRHPGLSPTVHDAPPLGGKLLSQQKRFSPTLGSTQVARAADSHENQAGVPGSRPVTSGGRV